MSADDRRRLWPLSADVAFLNHGSFGACPRAVLDVQSELRERMEREPVRFLHRELEGRLDEARAVLGGLVGAEPDDLAFVPNPTTAVNTVLASLRWEPGDEVVVTDHGYVACRNALDAAATRWGARVAVARVPFPIESPDQVVEAVLGQVTVRTRLALLDHVTSPTGLVFPIERLVPLLAARGVDTLVDGAHGPGMVPLDLRALSAAYYAGHCHKWLCAPKGAAFLHVRRDRHASIRPLVLSHGATRQHPRRSRFRLEFDWTGTDDPTAYLAVPAALAHVGGLVPGGWPAVMAENRRLALWARTLLCETVGVATPSPDAMIGSLAAVPLPPRARPPVAGEPDPLQTTLYDRFRTEVLVFSWPSPAVRVLRVSAQLYNSEAQYRGLSQALRSLASGADAAWTG